MTATVERSRRLDSSSTYQIDRRQPSAAKRGSEEFPVLMRAKRQNSLWADSASLARQGCGKPAFSAGLISVDETAVGPRGGAPPSSPGRDEFQRYGREALDASSASESLSLWLDPLQCALAQSPIVPTEPPQPCFAMNPALAMEQTWRAVRRMAWGGDRQRSVAYIELGAGDLTGAALTLEARGNAISVVVDLPPGASHADWAERLAKRLVRRGFDVERVDVR